MPSMKISQLADGSPAQDTDIFPIARSGANFSLSVEDVATNVLASSALTGTTTVQKLNNIVFADEQTGADWGAKVNAADAALGATAGEIWISQAAGTSAPAANVVISAKHVLRFIQSGGYSLGTHSIVVSGGASDSAVIGSPAGTLLTYTGSGSAIVVGTTSTDTLRVLIQNIQLQLQGAASTAVGISCFRSWWPIVRDCMVLSNNLGSVVNGQTAMLFDGTGGQSVYVNIQAPIIAGSFTNGIVFQNLGGLDSSIIGGSLNCETVTVQSGSTAISYDSTCGANRILSTDMEGWGTAIYCNGQANLFNARTELCNINVNFDTSSRGNFFEGTALNTPTDLGTFNQWILSPATGQAIGTKLQALTVAGPGGGSAAPLSFSGGVSIYEDSPGSAIAQRNGTTAQEFRLYTSLSSPNFQFLDFAGNYAGGQPGISVRGGGSFTASDFFLAALGSGSIRMQTPWVLQPVAVAGTPSASTNVSSPAGNFQGSYVSATATITSTSVTSNVVTVVCTNSLVAGNFVTLSGLTTSTFLNGQTLIVLSAGLSSSQFEASFTHANYSATSDTGTASKTGTDLWTLQNVLGSGTNPTSSLTVSHTGSSGVSTLALPTSVTQGASGQNVLSSNGHIKTGTDTAGQATVTAGNTTQAVSFTANYTGTAQPCIVLTPTSAPGTSYWVTYSGSTGAWTGFTVNVAASQAGNVTFNYLILAQA